MRTRLRAFTAGEAAGGPPASRRRSSQGRTRLIRLVDDLHVRGHRAVDRAIARDAGRAAVVAVQGKGAAGDGTPAEIQGRLVDGGGADPVGTLAAGGQR